MGWGQVVHESRKRAELQRARAELRMRKRGYPVQVEACADIPAVLTLAGALTAAVWWRKECGQSSPRDWKQLPGVAQLIQFVKSDTGTRRAPVRSKSKPKAKLIPPSKAAAAARPAPSLPPNRASGGGGSSSSPAAAAAAAAMARARVGEKSRAAAADSLMDSPSNESSAADCQAATPSTSYSSSSTQHSKPKKKKNKKKK